MNQTAPTAPPTIVVTGSIHYDLILHVPHLPGDNDRLAPTAMTLAPGGMGGNVAAASARLGGDVRFVGMFTDEEDGSTLRDDLVRDGVDVRWAGTRPAETRHRGMILVSHDGQRAILGAWPEASAISRAPGQAPGLVHELDWATRPRNAVSRFGFGSLDIPAAAFAGENVAFQCPFNFYPLVSDRVPLSVPMYMDIETGHITGWTDEQIWNGLRRATVIYGNQRNLAELARRLDEPSVTTLSRTLRGTIIETAGELGCQIHENGVRTVVPGFPVETIDTTGAGDCFAAACTLALRRGASLTEAARIANAAAALSTRALGSRPGVPTAAELDAFLATHTQASADAPDATLLSALPFGLRDLLNDNILAVDLVAPATGDEVATASELKGPSR